MGKLRSEVQLVRGELAQLPLSPPPPMLLLGYPTLQPLDAGRALACFAVDEVGTPGSNRCPQGQCLYIALPLLTYARAACDSWLARLACLARLLLTVIGSSIPFAGLGRALDGAAQVEEGADHVVSRKGPADAAAFRRDGRHVPRWRRGGRKGTAGDSTCGGGAPQAAQPASFTPLTLSLSPSHPHPLPLTLTLSPSLSHPLSPSPSHPPLPMRPLPLAPPPSSSLSPSHLPSLAAAPPSPPSLRLRRCTCCCSSGCHVMQRLPSTRW